ESFNRHRLSLVRGSAAACAAPAQQDSDDRRDNRHAEGRPSRDTTSAVVGAAVAALPAPASNQLAFAIGTRLGRRHHVGILARRFDGHRVNNAVDLDADKGEESEKEAGKNEGEGKSKEVDIGSGERSAE